MRRLLPALLITFAAFALGGGLRSAVAGETLQLGGPITGPAPGGGPAGPVVPVTGSAAAIAVFEGVDRSNRIATIERRGEEYRVYSGNRGAPIMTLKGDRIYDGATIRLDSILFTIRANRLIPGKSSNITGATCTLIGDKFYNGISQQLANLRFTLNHTRLYEQNKRTLADVKYSLSAPANQEVKFILAVLTDC